MLPSVSNATTEILRSYLKFKGQNLGYLSSIILEVEFGALTRILEENFGAKPPTTLYESTLLEHPPCV